MSKTLYCGRLRTAEQILALRTYHREYARKNPSKGHAWRKANPDKARESARLSMQKNRVANKELWTERGRKYRGYPTPIRPEPKVCELCDRPPNGKWKRLHLDHDHATGKFRGWLCDSHNRGLGHFQDDPALLRKAAIYLEQNS